jgi:hypothetical protein
MSPREVDILAAAGGVLEDAKRNARWTLALAVYLLCVAGVFVHRRGDLSFAVVAAGGMLSAGAVRRLRVLAAADTGQARRLVG